MTWTTRRRNIALIGGLAVLLAACGTAAGSTPQEITVNTSEEATSGISVSGMGEVTGTPDTVEVGLGVSVLGETVDEAATTAAEKAQALIDSLTSNGVAEEDITTTDYSIYPEYDYSSNEERLIGYRVSNTVKAKIRDLDSTGAVLDAATVAGGDDVVVNGLSFSIEDNDELVAAAREAAWNDAMTKANQLAELSGQTLGEATTITETVSMPPVPIPYAAEAAVRPGRRDPDRAGDVGCDHHASGPIRPRRLRNRLHDRSDLEVIMGITVSGAGEANADPDMVEIDVGVAVLADTVEDATQIAAQRAEAVTSALTAGGVRVEDMATTEYSIRPEYDYSEQPTAIAGLPGQQHRPRQAPRHRIDRPTARLDRLRRRRRDQGQRPQFRHRRRDITPGQGAGSGMERRQRQGRATGDSVRAHTRQGHLHHRDDPGPCGADAEDDGGRHGDGGEGVDPHRARHIDCDGDTPGGVRLPGVSTLGGIPPVLLTLRVATGERN